MRARVRAPKLTANPKTNKQTTAAVLERRGDRDRRRHRGARGGVQLQRSGRQGVPVDVAPQVSGDGGDGVGDVRQGQRGRSRPKPRCHRLHGVRPSDLHRVLRQGEKRCGGVEKATPSFFSSTVNT